jgi:hypothetical protein
VADVVVSQQRFIRNMQGQTANFSSFSDAKFDEEIFEAQLTDDRMPIMVCWYWILKLQARFMSGDYDTAILAAQKAKALFWSMEFHIQSVNYSLYRSSGGRFGRKAILNTTIESFFRTDRSSLSKVWVKPSLTLLASLSSLARSRTSPI